MPALRAQDEADATRVLRECMHTWGKCAGAANEPRRDRATIPGGTGRSELRDEGKRILGSKCNVCRRFSVWHATSVEMATLANMAEPGNVAPNENTGDEIAAAERALAEAAAKLEAARARAAGAAATAGAGGEGAGSDAANATAVPAAPAPAPSSASAPAPAPAPASASATGPAPLDGQAVDAIRAGYAAAGASLDVGMLINGGVVPDAPIRIPLAMMNRHGIICGATGTGKTKTLQVIAERLSHAGVPVFAPDMKGDLAGLALPGTASDKLTARTAALGQQWTPQGVPVEYFSLGGRGSGIPIRATVSSFGPLLLSRVLELNDTQESNLGLVFHYADAAGLPLVDLGDLRSVLQFLTSDEGEKELADLGGLSKQSVGVILRKLVNFADSGADALFGEHEMDTAQFLRQSADGKGIVSLLELPGVADSPVLFSSFVMWLLADLFNDLPEVGDLDKPKLVFFFDEAHLLFAHATKAFRDEITRTVRLIRSKGVGIFFVTQSPTDVPNEVLAQLASRVQHQLRAHTPDDAAALRQTVRTYPNSPYGLERLLTELPTGEAIVTVMNERGAPAPVAWTRVFAPESSMEARPTAEIDAAAAASPLAAQFSERVDPQSATEILAQKMNAAADAQRQAEEAARAEAERAAAEKARAADDAARAKAEREAERAARAEERVRSRQTTQSRGDGSVIGQVLGSRTGQTVVREVVRGVLGTLLRGGRR